MSLSYNQSSVIGGPLSKTVLDQLKARKSVISNPVGRPDVDLMYLNSTTGWVKMTSSIDAKDSETQQAGRYILVGGAAYQEGAKTKIKQGFYPEGGDISGYTVSDLTGFTPQPGITAFKVRSKNTFGTLREATVEFTVHSIEEFGILEQLFLRPGYTVLLEWGHSLYLNQEGQFQNTIKTFDTQRYLKSMNFNEIDREIINLKNKSFGNYDGIYGFIKNFSWSFNGYSYLCSVDIISKGELIESVALSIAPSYDLDVEAVDELITGQSTNAKEKTTDLHKFLYAIKNAGSKNYYDEEKPTITTSVNITGTVLNVFSNFGSSIPIVPAIDVQQAVEKEDVEKSIADDEIEKYLEDTMPTLYAAVKEELENQKLTVASQIIRFQVSNGDLNADYQWSRQITLRMLLILINKIFFINTGKDLNLVKFFTGNRADEKKPVINNFLTFTPHIGLNPTVCVLGKSRNPQTDLYYPISTQPNLSDTEQKDILNIFISSDHILEIADKMLTTPSVSQATVLELVQQVLTGVESNLGDINEFDLHHDDEVGTYYVVDRKVVPGDDNFNQFGVESFIDLIGLNSEIENLQIASKLSSNIASMIALAAQDSALPGGSSDVLSMQRWNEGLIDRHLKSKNVGDKLITNTDNQNTTSPTISYGDRDKFRRYVRSLDNQNVHYLRFNTSDLNGYKPIHTQLMREYSLYFSRRETTNPHGLIPFELSFTMKGIGGIKIGQAFKIPDQFLPKRYKGNVAFIVTGVEHSISSNRWVTNIKSQMIVTPSYTTVSPELEKSPIFQEQALYDLTYSSPLNRALNTRSDSQGGGDFTASRGGRLHLAWDLVANPFEAVKSPIRGKIYKIEFWSKPKNSDKWLAGIRIKGIGDYTGQIWRIGYVEIDPTLTPGKVVNAGQYIGTVQEMSKEYGEGMTNHIHIDIKTSINRTFAGIDPKTLPYV